jgi:ABC-type cobalamin/Fe3+-siderophores transport system ATPase subunit
VNWTTKRVVANNWLEPGIFLFIYHFVHGQFNFVDISYTEPTSGLDSAAAFRLVQTLRTIAEQGVSVVAVIHQPSTRVFELFHDVILMQQVGGVCSVCTCVCVCACFCACVCVCAYLAVCRCGVCKYAVCIFMCAGVLPCVGVWVRRVVTSSNTIDSLYPLQLTAQANKSNQIVRTCIPIHVG